ncbi:spore gernimation protein [Paenibacillus selenitireducens]|uniref:Spore gernimation protein n=1 Tax=Paenibacillus selenitireducens TaxID=1324314 RepID=A0A1T2X5G0_9BACL|nr:Ger(x)C family spore germination protein [Paenibacillus selenitireducens]OPA75090.1 spore gernimation protein [Paenibacillus selenitireducens]
MKSIWKMTGLILVSSCLLMSCVKTSVLEKLGLTVAVGYDLLQKDKLNVTSVLINPSVESKKKSEIITSEANSNKGARININNMSSHTLVSGQVRVVLFDDQLGKQGISVIIDNLSRDPFFGDMIFLAISDGSSNELLSHDYSQIPDIGMYLYEMLQQHIEDDWVPSCTVQDYRSALYSIGGDPILPILHKKDDSVEISGLALFSDDKVVGTIAPGEAYLLKLLQGKQKTDLKEISIDRNELHPFLLKKREGTVRVVISNIGSKTRFRLTSVQKLEFHVNVHMNVELQEITDHYDFRNPKAKTLLEQKIGKALSKETDRLIQKLQRMNSDAIGFGKVYRSTVRGSNLSRDKWHGMFPSAKIHSHFKVNIIRTGTTE